MSTTKSIEKKVISLYKRGWQVPNIAIILKAKPEVVEKILIERGFFEPCEK